MTGLEAASHQERGVMASDSFPYRILVVEDDPPLREIARHLLESKGYEVLGAED
jgi:PleD family two-component response regulator